MHTRKSEKKKKKGGELKSEKCENVENVKMWEG